MSSTDATTGGDASIIDLSASTAVTGLPGVDKPVPRENLLTRDQHLDALNKQAQKFEEKYRDAQQVVNLLSSEEGIEQLAASLAQQGYGRSFFEANGSSDEEKPATGSFGATSGQQATGQIDPAITAKIAELERNNAALMRAFAEAQANGAIEKEVAQVRQKNPNADLQQLATLATEKRQTFSLADAYALIERDTLEKENADLKEKLRRAELAKTIPGIDQLFESAPAPSKPVTPESRESLLRDIVRRASLADT